MVDRLLPEKSRCVLIGYISWASIRIKASLTTCISSFSLFLRILKLYISPSFFVLHAFASGGAVSESVRLREALKARRLACWRHFLVASCRVPHSGKEFALMIVCLVEYGWWRVGDVCQQNRRGLAMRVMVARQAVMAEPCSGVFDAGRYY